MRETMQALFEQYGQEVRCLSGDEVWKAYIQPVRRKDEEADLTVTELGDVDHRLWLYIGPADFPLWNGVELLAGGERFRVRERVQEQLAGMALYERALLVKAKEGAR